MTEISKDGTINIGGWQDGIGQSSLDGFSDMMGVNIADNPGSVSSNLKFNKIQETTASQTVTFVDATDIFTSSGDIRYRGVGNGRAITFSTTGTLPTGITAGQIYYIQELSYNTFKICDTLKNVGITYVSITGGTGTLSINFIMPKAVTYWTKNGQGRIFALDSNQRVWFCGNNAVTDPWYLITGNTGQGNGDGNGIIYYKGYILVFTAGAVDALTDIQSSTDTITWKLAFDTINISNSMANDGRGACPFLSVNDDAIYFANGLSDYGQPHRIGLFEEIAGQTFNPNTGTTFSFVEDVVTLPNENGKGQATCIRELGQNLVIGTDTDKVYFWDKKSPSFTYFLQIQETGIRSMETIGDLAYLFIQDSGSIYACNTTSSTLLLKLPEQISNQYYLYFDGINTFEVSDTDIYKRELLFSVSIATSAVYPNERVQNYLMSYNVDTKKLTKKNISALGETTEKNGNFYGKIHSIFANGKNILMSSSSYDISDDAYTYAVESLYYKANLGSGYNGYYVYDNYEPYIITGLIPYGDIYSKRTVKELSLSFLKPLITGQGVKISYRRDTNTSWTVLKTIDYATNGAIKELKIEAPITDIIDIQFKIEITSYNNNPYTTRLVAESPRLKLIRLIP